MRSFSSSLWVLFLCTFTLVLLSGAACAAEDGINLTQDMDQSGSLNVSAVADNVTGSMTTTEALYAVDTITTPAPSANTEYVNETPGIGSSPDGNPFAGQYAQGGFNIEIGASITEGRGNLLNESETMTLKDSTEVQGYVKTLMKTFTYESGINP